LIKGKGIGEEGLKKDSISSAREGELESGDSTLESSNGGD
jgi:hypothetical protein